MAQIEGVALPLKKRIEYALCYLRGVGLWTARKVLSKLGIDYDTRVQNLTDQQVASIQKELTSNYAIEGKLAEEIHSNIRRLREIRCYRGSRHAAGLPVHGQRTKTNARTRKGPKRGAVALKRKVTKK